MNKPEAATVDALGQLAAAKHAYLQAGEALAKAIRASLPNQVRAVFPSASGIVCHGHWDRHNNRRLQLVEIWDSEGLIAHREHATDRSNGAAAAFDTLTTAAGDLQSDLDWLAELEGDELISPKPISFRFAPADPV